MFSKTRFRLGWFLGAALLLAWPVMAQQEQRGPAGPGGDNPEDDSTPIFSFQISSELLANALDLLVEKRLAKDYGLDEYQHEQMRQVLHEHVPRFLREHREELQRLWTDWTEAISRGQPPDPEYAAEWAQRALPMAEAFQALVGGMATDMREFMTDDQQVLLDGYLAVVDTGTNVVNSRLQEFAHGGFDPERHWPGYKRVRQRSPEELRELRLDMEYARAAAMDRSRQARRAGGAQAAPRSEAELVADALAAAPQSNTSKHKSSKDEWTRYVEEFIRRYQLNDEQKQKAYSLLQQQKDRRERYFLTRGGEMERVNKMYANAQTKEQLALADSAYRKLNQPLERMFEQLKQKLDTLPTRSQRRAAALSEMKAPKQRKPAPTGEAGDRRPQ